MSSPPCDVGVMSTFRLQIARATVLAQLLFVGGWLGIGVLEGHGYRPMRHDISDLAALTAHYATADRVTLAIAGSLTIAFAFVLRHHLGSAALVLALSLPGLDTLTDTFFRLDCRAADAGCSISDAIASWHGKAHVAIFALSALATVAAPFVLARAMRRHEGWMSFARAAKLFGFLTIAVLVARVPPRVRRSAASLSESRRPWSAAGSRSWRGGSHGWRAGRGAGSPPSWLGAVKLPTSPCWVA